MGALDDRPLYLLSRGHLCDDRNFSAFSCPLLRQPCTLTPHLAAASEQTTSQLAEGLWYRSNKQQHSTPVSTMRQPPGTGWTLAAADVLTVPDAPVDKLLNVRPWNPGSAAH